MTPHVPKKGDGNVSETESAHREEPYFGAQAAGAEIGQRAMSKTYILIIHTNALPGCIGGATLTRCILITGIVLFELGKCFARRTFAMFHAVDALNGPVEGCSTIYNSESFISIVDLS